MAAYTFIDTRLRRTDIFSLTNYDDDEQHTVTYSRENGDVFTPMSAFDYGIAKASLIAQHCQIIRLDPIVEVARTQLENPLHRRTTIFTHQDIIFRIMVPRPVPTLSNVSKAAAI